jgi:hypothetical protein
VLDARVVDENVDPPETGNRLFDETGGFCALHEVGVIVDDSGARVVALEFGENPLDILRLTEAVDDDVGAGSGKCARNAKADTTRRSGDDCNAARKRLREI